MSGTIGIPANGAGSADEGNILQLGTYVQGERGTYVVCVADEAITQYDAVAILPDFGIERLDAANDLAGRLIGVVDRGVTSGNYVSVQVSGWALVQSANSTAANDQLFATSTAGEVAASGGFAIDTGMVGLTAEGTGTAPDGTSVAEGFQLVQLAHPQLAWA